MCRMALQKTARSVSTVHWSGRDSRAPSGGNTTPSLAQRFEKRHEVAEVLRAEHLGQCVGHQRGVECTPLHDRAMIVGASVAALRLALAAQIVIAIAPLPRMLVSPRARTKVGALVRLYVLREWLGRGVGEALMRACLNEARSAGYETIWLGVWERNVRAQAFYRKWNFRDVGEQVFLLGSDEQRDIVMERAVIRS